MPRTADDIETYLHRLNRTFDRQESTFVVSTGADRAPIALYVAEPVVLARIMVGRVPSDDKRKLALFQKMLEYNAADLMHASYGVSGEEVVLTAAEELENVDENELAASLSDLDLAMTRHLATLHDLAQE